ncbi:hypothetical protein CEXT_532311 [Caerostris extrusa]|uniref:Uncharacterized protein n=1 Tax=Caerostris extrusa TaxID=172846 RepID=A0AAV4SSL4_CAEEX|nr:hypothetical protein CEXT_532311 [Caerostris extrusa]
MHHSIEKYTPVPHFATVLPPQIEKAHRKREIKRSNLRGVDKVQEPRKNFRGRKNKNPTNICMSSGLMWMRSVPTSERNSARSLQKRHTTSQSPYCRRKTLF